MKRLSCVWHPLIPLALVTAGCCPIAKRGPEGYGPPVSGTRSVALWLTDGSPSVFTDTDKFPDCPTGGLFSQPHEGRPDVAVAGLGRIADDTGGYDAEAEFVVVFDRPLAELPPIDGRTRARLHGLIETKSIQRLLGRDPIAWGPSSVGNNVMTEGPGLELSGLRMLGCAAFKATRLDIAFSSRAGRQVRHQATLADLPEVDAVIRYLQAVQDRCKEPGASPACRRIRAVNLGALGANSAYVNETGRKLRAAVAAFARDPASVIRRSEDGGKIFAERARHQLAGALLCGDDGAAPGPITITLTLPSGNTAGTGALVVSAP